VKVCRACFATVPVACKVCPECGAPFPLAEPKALPRTRNGQLVEVREWHHVERSRAGIAAAIAQCRSWQELKGLGGTWATRKVGLFTRRATVDGGPIVNGMGYTVGFVPPRVAMGRGAGRAPARPEPPSGPGLVRRADAETADKGPPGGLERPSPAEGPRHARDPASAEIGPLMSHDEALARALLAVTRAGGRAWRTEVGLFRDPRGRPHFIGTRGMSDLLGICRGGRALSVEVKTGRGARTPEQVAWAGMWVRFGGLYVLARYADAEDGDATIAAALSTGVARVHTRLSTADAPRQQESTPAAGDKPTTRR
jgi:hypothetical protein